MTSAEWMKLRFGTDKQGQVAHILSAVANILLSLGMIVYFSKGAGKFLTYFLPYSEFTCMAVMVAIGLTYTLMSGLYGVVFTDVIQMILMVFTALYITIAAFALAPSVSLPGGFLDFDLATPVGGAALMAKDTATWEPIFGMFGICVFMWVFRSTLEGMGGVGGYTDQRFFAARNEREASLLTMEAIVLSVFRWTMVAGLVVMGLHIMQEGLPGAADISLDSENVLPVVLGQALPAGVRGLVIAGLIAAAMSTFDSTLNAGASYFVKDIYESYLNPKATGDQLLSVSRWATVGLCVGGVSLAMIVPNINQIWGLITMGLGAGLFVPLALRWYWPRLNGYGFAAGTAGGVVAALVFKALLKWELYTSFPSIIGTALFMAVLVSLLTPATSDKILVRFWIQINPWGLWKGYALQAKASGEIDVEKMRARKLERMKDALSLCLTIPFQICLLVGAMAFVFHDWEKFTYFAIISVLCGVGLYFFWFKNLKSVKECTEEDKHYASLK
jgi:Na+/proline symporter